MGQDENVKELGTFLRTKKVREAAEAATREKVAAASKERFGKSLKKKFQTTMIGALARFEERFGYVWGHGKPDEELTPEEQEAREAWALVRTEILNNGNTQLRHILDELSRYRLSYEGYRMSLPFKPLESKDES